MTLPTIDEKPIRRRWLSTKTADACLDWVIFPCLLFIQFGATLYCQQESGQEGLDPEVSTIFCLSCVAIFCAIAGFYRKIVRLHPCESMALLLLPEVLTNLLLAWVMIGSLDQAVKLLICSSGLLAVIGGVALAHSQILRHRERAVLLSSDHYELIVDVSTKGINPGVIHDDDEDGSDEEWVC